MGAGHRLPNRYDRKAVVFGGLGLAGGRLRPNPIHAQPARPPRGQDEEKMSKLRRGRPRLRRQGKTSKCPRALTTILSSVSGSMDSIVVSAALIPLALKSLTARVLAPCRTPNLRLGTHLPSRASSSSAECGPVSHPRSTSRKVSLSTAASNSGSDDPLGADWRSATARRDPRHRSAISTEANFSLAGKTPVEGKGPAIGKPVARWCVRVSTLGNPNRPQHFFEHEDLLASHDLPDVLVHALVQTSFLWL